MARYRYLSTTSMLLAILVLTGCASAPERQLSSVVPNFAMLPDGLNPLTQKRIMHTEESLELRHGRPLKVLLLSGGGQNGAFGAGVLKGWRESETRPTFDLVTGISSGALIATFAYLGEPRDDETLKELYTGITQSDIYDSDDLAERVLFGGSSLMDTAPMKRLIAQHITEEILARVAAEHAKGRWLLVGATNLDTGQLWVFVLSALAREGGPQALETFRSILLAASSPPVVFPPVEIFGYLFADGATVNNLLIAGLAGQTKRFPPNVPKGQVWLIHNGRLSSPAKAHAVTRSLLPILGKTLTIAMDARMGSTLLRAYAVTRAHAYGFNLLEIPADVEMGHDALAFDHEEMVRLFDAGRRLGRRPESWTHEPPVTPEVSPDIVKALKQIRPFLTE
jgi:predicted acylesterase/phospholipase RssA